MVNGFPPNCYSPEAKRSKDNLRRYSRLALLQLVKSDLLNAYKGNVEMFECLVSTQQRCPVHHNLLYGVLKLYIYIVGAMLLIIFILPPSNKTPKHFTETWPTL